MKQIIHEIVNLFLEINIENCSETIWKSSFTYETDSLNLPEEIDLKKSFKSFDTNDRLEIIISLDDTAPITLYNTELDKISDFLDEISSIIDVAQPDSKFDLTLSIKKNFDTNIVNIYSYDLFIDYIRSCSLEELMSIFNQIVNDYNIKSFVLHDKEIFIETGAFEFINSNNYPSQFSKADSSRSDVLKLRKEISFFEQSPSLDLIPDDFHVYALSEENVLTKYIKQLAVLNSIIYLSNLSELSDPSHYYFKINGYKSVSNKISLNQINIGQEEEIFKIYKWVYSKGGTSDKIGLARNILSLTIDTSSLEIKKDTFNSILSSYEIYLKENVDKYIQIKNSISEYLVIASNKASSIVENIGSSFRKNLLAFITYFFTVIVIRIISSRSIDNLFTKEIAWLTYSFLLASLVLLGLTYLDSKSEKKRFDEVYNKLRSRYKDLLVEADLDSIFDNDSEHKKDVEYIENKMKIYCVCWLIVIVLFSIIVYSISDFS